LQLLNFATAFFLENFKDWYIKMSDSLTIPQTMAGKKGVADVTNAIKRKQITSVLLAIKNATTTNLIPACVINERNSVLEQVRVSFNVASTFTNDVTFTLYDIDNATNLGSYTASGGYGSTGLKYESFDISSANNALSASGKIKVFITITQADYNKIEDFTTILQYREDLDS